MAEEAKEEELEYESDPEEAKLSLKMRRREASDDEEEDIERNGDERGKRDKQKPPRRIVDSDGESDGQGAAAEYEEEVEDEEEYVEDDDEIIDEDEDEEYDEEEYEERGLEVGQADAAVNEVVEAEVEVEGGKGLAEESVRGVTIEGQKGMVDDRNDDVNVNENEEKEEEEEKKENEPYAVPTAGAFYMHDDRFRDNAGGRHRRTFGGRKLWESKDDKKWGHDKFEELTMQERHYEEGRRTSRGRYRSRGRSRGAERGYGRGNRPRLTPSNNPNKNNNQNNAPKSVRGRGPRRYQPSFKHNNDAPPTQNIISGKSAEKLPNSNSVRTSAPPSNVESEAVPAKKNVFASSLNSASPPFYPSSSSSKEIPFTQKRDGKSGMSNRNVQPSASEENFSVAQSSAIQRGKSVVDSLGMDKIYIDNTASGKLSANLRLPPSGSSSMSSNQSLQVRAHGRGINSMAQGNYQPSGSNNQVNRISSPAQMHATQRNPGQSRGQSSVQQFAQNPGSSSQVSSPPKAAVSKSSFEPGEAESPPEASQSKTALVNKAKGNAQGTGRGSYLFGGAQVMGPLGNLGNSPGDQNFPAFFPVMQFGGQHPTGGIRVPAVGMAFPGYVAQSQHGGMGNSEMTWLPVLAGAAGALGTTYCPPYIAVDGAYQARPSGQPSSLPPTKENSANKPGNEWKPSQRPEAANDDFGQRQKNPRRYTEMKFDQ